MKKLRIGIVGCGFIANGKHLPGLSKLSDKVDIAAFCDIIPERAEKAKAKYGSADSYVCTDYRKLVDDKSLDVIHVCTPNVTHCEITCAALEAGKHVMCEKPMAVTYAEAKKMVDTAKRVGKKLTIGYQNRFRDDAIYLRNMVDNGRLGDIYYAQANAMRRRCVPTWGVFMNKALQGGGPLIDLGTHALDLTLWYMGNYEPESVSGSVFYKMGDKTEGNLCGPWKPEEYEVEDSAFGFIRMKNGATINLSASWVLNIMEPREACTTLCGTEGGAEMRQKGEDYTCLINYADGGRLVDATVDFTQKIAFGPDTVEEKPGDREAAQWIDAILNDHDPLVLPEQAMVVTQLLEAIYEAGRTGKTVYL
jgi:predicted dehydrogenase